MRFRYVCLMIIGALLLGTLSVMVYFVFDPAFFPVATSATEDQGKAVPWEPFFKFLSGSVLFLLLVGYVTFGVIFCPWRKRRQCRRQYLGS